MLLIEGEIGQAKQKKVFVRESIDCVKMLSEKFGKKIVVRSKIGGLIECMLYGGLTSSLVSTLGELARIENGSLQHQIQIRVINLIALILTGKPFNFISSIQRTNVRGTRVVRGSSNLSNASDGSDSGYVSMIIGNNSQLEPNIPLNVVRDSFFDKETLKDITTKTIQGYNFYTSQVGNTYDRVLMVRLALKTVADFHFSHFPEAILHFIQETVLKYLEDENPSIRKDAIKTGCSLYIRPEDRSPVVEGMIQDILDRFLTVALADVDYKIRCNMLKYLNSKFDIYLAAEKNIILLFQCTNDHVFEVRQHAFEILVRVRTYSPAVIDPYLRNHLVQLLSKLEYPTDDKEKEEATKILTLLISKAANTLQTYTGAFIKALLPRLRKPSGSGLTSAIIEAIGALSAVTQLYIYYIYRKEGK